MNEYTKGSFVKKAKLQLDEFAPSELNKNFFSLPHGIAASETLSTGAKILYATLFTLGKKHDTAFATKEALQKFLGNPSKSALFRWQKELVNEGFIRVLQKGRGLSNNYYFLRHPALNNADIGEFEAGPRPLYRDRKYNTQTIVSEEEGLYIFEERLREWYEVNTNGGFMELPKPGFKMKASQRHELESKWQKRLSDDVVNGKVKLTPINDTATSTHNEVQTLNTASGTEPQNYDAVFTNDSSNMGLNDIKMKLSDEPVKTTLPSGQILYGPSSHACYIAEMKRRKENEARNEEIRKQRAIAM